MDRRTELIAGTALDFPGMHCIIGKCIGRGSNAIVYESEYCDATAPALKHRVLIKELFPYDENGHIWRDEKQHISMDAQGEATWELHRRSFERGNDIHLRLLAQTPDQIGGNLNTFALNGTLYTLLDYTGGRSMDKALHSSSHQTLDQIAERMRKLLFALRAFHEQGFLHLDISLDNVLLIGHGETERVLLIDYNSVYACGELQNSRSVYISAKEGFTPPEVRVGMVQAIAPCTDLFSATCVFYALLTGAPPMTAQMSRRKTPDAADSPYLKDVPATVQAQIGLILRRGLCVLPDRRYQCCDDMLRDLEELQRRIHGVGVTHAALWEAGRRSVRRLVQQNPSLDYVQREAELYPLYMRFEHGGGMPAKAFMQALEQGEATSAILLGNGGTGKSTALLRTALERTVRYSPTQPAVVYLSLMGKKCGEPNYILDHILMEIHFEAQTKTMEDARHALITLLDSPQKANGSNVRLLLLLDGLNEAIGDTTGLFEELKRLSVYPALRMVIASRTAPEELNMAHAYMMSLESFQVCDMLTSHGLLLPEGEEMRELLKTPMMLSLFIQTAKHTESQILCQSQEELISAYLDALCLKAARDGSRPVDYQVEAAVRMVLPAIACEIQRQGQPLNDQALFRVARQCHSVLRSRVLTSAFPAWIGHSTEVLGAHTDNAEAWYGEIVQNLLWQKLGLLVRDEACCYHVLHQILLDYFVVQAAANRRRVWGCRLKTGAFASVVLLLLACVSLAVYEVWLKPEPYDETMSKKIIDAATMQYVSCGLQYKAMTDMLADQIDADACEAKITAAGVPASRSAEVALDVMKTDGEVIQWSNQPFDVENAEILLALPQERAATYARYIAAYRLVSTGKTSTTKSEFFQALTGLLEADADVTWLLERAVCTPHVEGMDTQQRLSFDTGRLSLPDAQENRSIDVSNGMSYALEKAYERRRLALNELNRLAVMYAPAVKEDGA